MEPLLDILLRHKEPIIAQFTARYSLFVSSVTSIIFAFIRIQNSNSFVSFVTISPYVFFILSSSLFMGIVSLFGMRRDSVWTILWRATIGIVISLFFGIWAFCIWRLSQINFA